MSVEAINTQRLQAPLPGNVIVGNRQTGGIPKAAGEGRPREQTQAKSDIPVSDNLLTTLNADLEAIHNVGLQFSVFHKTGQMVVRVVDKDTGELVRQIPPKELLDLAAKLEDMVGILFDKRV